VALCRQHHTVRSCSSIRSGPPSNDLNRITLFITIVTKALLQFSTQASVGVAHKTLPTDRPRCSIHIRDLSLQAISSSVAVLYIKSNHRLAGFFVKKGAFVETDNTVGSCAPGDEATPECPCRGQEEPQEERCESIAQ
jgi:hypothetical protein